MRLFGRLGQQSRRFQVHLGIPGGWVALVIPRPRGRWSLVVGKNALKRDNNREYMVGFLGLH